MSPPPQAPVASLFHFGSFSKARLEAFSDGVFAFIPIYFIFPRHVRGARGNNDNMHRCKDEAFAIKTRVLDSCANASPLPAVKRRQL
jgi:hypothetical protein